MLKETGMGDAEHGKFHPSHSALFSSQRSSTFGRFVKKKWEQIWDLRALPGHQEGDGLRLPSAAQRCPPSPLPTPGTKQVFNSGTTLTHFLFYLICTCTKKDPFTIITICNWAAPTGELSLFLHFLMCWGFSIPWRLSAYCTKPSWGSYLSKGLPSPSCVHPSGLLRMQIPFGYRSWGLGQAAARSQLRTFHLQIWQPHGSQQQQ